MNGAVRLASTTSWVAPDCTETTQTTAKTARHKNEKSPVENGTLRASPRDSSSLHTKAEGMGFEPTTPCGAPDFESFTNVQNARGYAGF
jgi:hypothetical protein